MKVIKGFHNLIYFLSQNIDLITQNIDKKLIFRDTKLKFRVTKKVIKNTFITQNIEFKKKSKFGDMNVKNISTKNKIEIST